MKAVEDIACYHLTPDRHCVLKTGFQASHDAFIVKSALGRRPHCSRHTGSVLLVTYECLQLHVFVFQSCLGSTGAFPGRVCSVYSSFCASGNHMTDSILMWLSQCNSTDVKEFTKGLEVILHTAHLLGVAHLTGKKRRRDKLHSEVLLGYR